MQKRKTFSREFKLEAVRLLDQGDKSAAELARELGIKRNQLYKWTAVLDKHPTLGRRRAPLAQVGDDRMTGLPREWQHGAATGLACSQAYRAAAPVDVLKMQFCEFAGA